MMRYATLVDMESDFELPQDHPGVNDPHYRERRAAISQTSARWRSGREIPSVDYTPEEHDLWAKACAELTVSHRDQAARAFRDGAARLGLPVDRIPHLGDVSRELHGLSGFSVGVVPGLVPARDFYGSLADRVFLSTQYLRHPSVPFYTPEPDVIHEAVGHLNMLANPLFAELHQLAGEASRRCQTDSALEFFSRVFWFTLEFGVTYENGAVKAYGAGLASSIGELQVFHNAETRPFDIASMGTLDYDITQYQPVLFAVESMGQLADELGGFFASFDDEHHARLTHLPRAS